MWYWSMSLFYYESFFVSGKGRVKLVLVLGKDRSMVNIGDIEEVIRLKEFSNEVVSSGMNVGIKGIWILFVSEVKLEIFVWVSDEGGGVEVVVYLLELEISIGEGVMLIGWELLDCSVEMIFSSIFLIVWVIVVARALGEKSGGFIEGKIIVVEVVEVVIWEIFFMLGKMVFGSVDDVGVNC